MPPLPPVLRSPLVALLIGSPGAMAEDRLSLQISGGYTSVDGSADLDVRVGPGVFGAEAPGRQVELPVPFEADDVSREAAVAVRVWRRLHVRGGYVDMGRFGSEPFFITTITGDDADRTLSQVSLDARGWIAGVELDRPLTDRFTVYGRANALRVEFDARGGAPPGFVVEDPHARTGWSWCVGGRYALHPRVWLGMAFSQYDVKLEKLNSYQLTLQLDLL